MSIAFWKQEAWDIGYTVVVEIRQHFLDRQAQVERIGTSQFESNRKLKIR